MDFGLKNASPLEFLSPKSPSKTLRITSTKVLISHPTTTWGWPTTPSPSKPALRLGSFSELTLQAVPSPSEQPSILNLRCRYYSQLREEISEFLNATALIFSSAWLACFGFIKAVAKDYDHVLLDELCDPALFEGARYTTKSVHSFKHLDEKDMESKLRELRSTKKNGILVVTDCLFNMDSSSPNLINYQKITSEYQAYLLLNIGHDFGIFGPTGKGIWEEQGLSELNNVFFVGSGSKTLGVNYGFIALPGAKGALISFWKYFCSTYMFTNAINPIQANSGLATLRMARSHLGS